MNYVILQKGRSLPEWKEYLQLELEYAHPRDHTKRIGKSKKDGKWYGFSHRAIHGYKNRKQAVEFADSVR